MKKKRTRPPRRAAAQKEVVESAPSLRIPSGIVGLDEVTEGGLRDHTVTVVVGASGTGKSSFAMQYLLHGLDAGEQGLYITLDVSPEQILQESSLWGWERVREHVDNRLFFFASTGSNFKEIVSDQLPRLVEARKRYETRTRVVIDPLTPILWAERDKSVQRELIGKLFGMLKEMGSVVATVEEHGQSVDGNEKGESIPVYLSDSVLHLRYQPIGGAFNRTLEIVKMRGTRHGEEVYPYIFARGIGAIVRSTPVYHEEKARAYGEVFEQAIEAAKREQADPVVVESLERMRDNWAYDHSPREALEKVLQHSHIAKTG